jgi:uncharacterized protein (TIGR02757 family)
MNKEQLKEFLETKYLQYNQPDFISSDPISIPHQFKKKEDIEISAFLAATIAWGQRITILKNAKLLLSMMDNNPHDFILNFTKDDLKPFEKFYHRTFNGHDAQFFLTSLQNIYRHQGGLEKIFKAPPPPKGGRKTSVYQATRVSIASPSFGGVGEAIIHARSLFFQPEHFKRTEKHFSDPKQKSAAKRINMFLRWMVRKDKNGVDFGIWKSISASQLICPLDVHSGRVARKLGLLKRKQNDWQAAEELTTSLRRFDPNDPVKYDFALFGLGVFEKF